MQRTGAVFAQKCVKPVLPNVISSRMNVANDVQRNAEDVQRNAVKWQLNNFYSTGYWQLLR